MKLKYILIFLVGVLVLAATEYFFLVELNGQNRPVVLLLTSALAVISIVTIFKCYKRIS
jgi:hypothetical protein